jgi:hypothetical protein
MDSPKDEILDVIAKKLARLLTDNEVGWLSVANWLDKLAWDRGIDVGVDFNSADDWAASAVKALRSHFDPTRFPDGTVWIERCDFVEDLFQKLLPDTMPRT